jgi:predicted ATPase
MIERLYVHNFRCLENFTLDLKGRGSVLIIGKNGSGKSTLRQAFGVFQSICRGANRVKAWIDASDFTQHRKDIPMRFEIELKLNEKHYKYAISFEMPDNFREARVAEESLVVAGEEIFSRQRSQISLPGGSTFGLDWHVAALPVFEERSGKSTVQPLKDFLASTILIAPVPREMSGFSDEESVELQENAGNCSAWFNTLIIHTPAAYPCIVTYLQSLIPDFESFENRPRGEEGKQLSVVFEQKQTRKQLLLEFNKLSDGEKCFFLSALIVASNKVSSNPVFCMWDEPDNHLSLPEIGHFVTQLRKLANRNGQFIATSHHPETIRQFSDDSTLVFSRKSHLEPTVVRPLADLEYSGDLIEAIIRGEVIE